MTSSHDVLDDAIRAEDVAAVARLLESDPSLANGPAEVVTPPLQIAIGVTGNASIVQLLIDHGADLESVCQDTEATPLIYAVVFTRTHLIPLLAASGANLGPGADGRTPRELAESLPRKDLQEMGVTGTREQYGEIAQLLASLGG